MYLLSSQTYLHFLCEIWYNTKTYQLLNIYVKPYSYLKYEPGGACCLFDMLLGEHGQILKARIQLKTIFN